MHGENEFPHVLVVDDNDDAVEVLALLIEGEGFTVATARTLQAAREQVARQRPRLVLLDLNLPDGSGLDLLAELKADQVTASAEVVLLTGMVDGRLSEQAHLLGAATVLVKPLEHADLCAVLDRAR